MLSLSFETSMISVCIVLSLVIPRWDSILFPVFQGILFFFHLTDGYNQWETCIIVVPTVQIFFDTRQKLIWYVEVNRKLMTGDLICHDQFGIIRSKIFDSFSSSSTYL